MADLKIEGVDGQPVEGDVIVHEDGQWKTATENFIKADGSREYASLVSYQTQQTFTDNEHIPDKKYVDEQIEDLLGSPRGPLSQEYIKISSSGGGLPSETGIIDNIWIGKESAASETGGGSGAQRDVFIGSLNTFGISSDFVDSVVLGSGFSHIRAGLYGAEVLLGDRVRTDGIYLTPTVRISNALDVYNDSAIFSTSLSIGSITRHDNHSRIGVNSSYLNLTNYSGVLTIKGTGSPTGNKILELPHHSSGSLPSVLSGGWIYITETKKPAFSDGTNWRYFSDDSVV